MLIEASSLRIFILAVAMLPCQTFECFLQHGQTAEKIIQHFLLSILKTFFYYAHIIPFLFFLKFRYGDNNNTLFQDVKIGQHL